MARIAWVLSDPTTLASYSFEVNPNSQQGPSYHKNFSYTSTAAPDGKTLVFEGMDQPLKIDVSGVLLTENQYTTLITWWNKRNQIQLTDDLGRSWFVIIESFEPKREKTSRNYPWRMTWSMSLTVVSWP